MILVPMEGLKAGIRSIKVAGVCIFLVKSSEGLESSLYVDLLGSSCVHG